MSEEFFYRPILNRDRLIHIIDADASTCEALSVLFRLEGFQTTFSLDAPSFFAAIDRRRPDAVVLNLHVGPEDGVAMLRRLKALRIGMPVFMLSNHPDVEGAVQAMRGGAFDVVTKPIDTDHLVRSLMQAMRQDVHLGAVDSGRRLIEVHGFSQLTPRERQVLQLITNGQSNKEAGRELGISPRTIEVHRARVMEKLGAKNTADLIRIVLTS